MRGKVLLRGLNLRHNRITPAHAGKSDLFSVNEFVQVDHPRTCGEKIKEFFSPAAEWGSPPHMRGKGFALNIVVIYWRITPAHAGKRFNIKYNGGDRWDHPRTCGEKSTL